MLSEFYGAKGNSAGQNEHYIKALEYFKKTGVSEKEVEEQSVLSEIGFDSKRLNAENITVTNNEYKVGKNIVDDLINLSLEDLEKYFIPFEKDFADVPAAIISAYNNMASKLTKIGEYDKAEMLYSKAMKHCDGSTPKGKLKIAMILNNLAGVHVEKKRHKKAKEVMEKAKTMIENIDTDEVKIFRGRIDNNMTILDRKITEECLGN
jgi:tetratricopeptide (TPR) repeat protein